jgi:FAD/FMN-containing dehydrogenase
MSQPDPSPAALAVRDACPERVVLPGDARYDDARTPWNLAVDQRPAAVALPRTVEEVSRVIRAAAAQGLRVAPQSTGHGAAPLAGRLDGAVLLRLSELTGVEIDTERHVARVVGGTLWGDVVAAATPHGLTALHGSAHDVAVAGYALSGGLSFYARQHGLAAHSILAAEVVTADGSVVRATAEDHPDLFWALRGGGGNFGAVVALELRLLPVADVVAGMLLWPMDRAAEVTRTWVEWTREVPESVSTTLRLMSFPPLPELPPFLSGRSIVVVDGALLEDDDRAAQLLGALRALAPEMDTFGRIPAAELLAVHMDPPGPTPSVSGHALLGPLDDAAVDALLRNVGPGTGSALLFAELRHIGGAAGRPVADAALSHLAGVYTLFCAAIAPTPEAAAVGSADAAALVETMAPWAEAMRVLTLTETVVDAATGVDAEAWARLREVRAQVDPAGVFLANHEIR